MPATTVVETPLTASVVRLLPPAPNTAGLRLRTALRAGECNGTAGRCPAGQHPISYTGPRGIYVTRCFDCGYDW